MTDGPVVGDETVGTRLRTRRNHGAYHLRSTRPRPGMGPTPPHHRPPPPGRSPRRRGAPRRCRSRDPGLHRVPQSPLAADLDGFSSGGIQRTGLGAQSSSCPITSRLRRRTRWWGCMTSCGWHGWPARNGRANLPRPARLPLVADQVSPAVTLAAMARQVFFLTSCASPLGRGPQAARTGWLGLFTPSRTVAQANSVMSATHSGLLNPLCEVSER